MFDERYASGADGMGMDMGSAAGFWSSSGQQPAPQQQQQQQQQASADTLLRSPVPPQQMEELDDAFVTHSNQHAFADQYTLKQQAPQQYNPLGGALAAHAPPAHLFANSFSPFHHATFEVEGDLNGVNPSEQMAQARRNAQAMFGAGAAGQLQQQHGMAMPQPPQRVQTSDLHLYASSSPIGQIPPSSSEFDAGLDSVAGGAAYDSLIDRAEQQAQGSRKRARGNTGAAMPPLPSAFDGSPAAAAANASSFQEPRDLHASTFGVYGSSVLQNLTQQQQPVSVAPSRAAGGRLRAAPAVSVHMPSSSAQSHSSGADSPPPQSLQLVSPSMRGGSAAAASSGHAGGAKGEIQKKEKHQLTDRQRRAKIKESMDLLKAELPLESGVKADQATIVASSVALMKSLKDEVAELREKLQAMEMAQESEDAKLESRRLEMRGRMQAQLQSGDGSSAASAAADESHMPPLSNAPFTSMMASLNGAGVSMLRMGLNGAIIEVNLVFELVSGFRAADVVGHTPCHPPMFGSLSIMPSAFLKAFALVAPVPAPQPHSFQQFPPPQQPEAKSPHPHSHYYPAHSHSHSHSHSSASTPNGLAPLSPSNDSHSASASPFTPLQAQSAHDTPPAPTTLDDSGSSGSIGSGGGFPAAADIGPATATVNPASLAGGGSGGSGGGGSGGQPHSSMSQTSVAPLYANASISHFPIVPQRELQNFFPYKCRSLIDAAFTAGVTQPQPHGNFLVSHLAALPANHVLKLLCRHHTLWGEVLESIVTLCLVRTPKGDPDHIIMLSTPDCRRLLTPATHQQSVHMQVISPENIAQADAVHY